MASISFSRFTLGFSGLNNPSTQKASKDLKMFTHMFPRPSRRRLDLIASKASVTQQPTERRRNNHHHINSLPKAYEAPCYVEQAEKLIREVKEMFNGMSTQNSFVHERLSMVDKVERLGIDRHFKKEIKEALDYVYRYWNDKGIVNGESGACADLNTTALAFRILRLHRYQVSSAGGSVEPKDYAFRIGFAKIASLATVIDDIYDTYGTLDELKLFTNAIKRWDLRFAIDCLPEYMKVVFIMFYEMVNAITQEAIKTQGRDTLDYARNAWDLFFNSYLQEAEWLATGYIPTFDEYLENGKISGGA